MGIIYGLKLHQTIVGIVVLQICHDNLCIRNTHYNLPFPFDVEGPLQLKYRRALTQELTQVGIYTWSSTYDLCYLRPTPTSTQEHDPDMYCTVSLSKR
jgi:hypothetical protein